MKKVFAYFFVLVFLFSVLPVREIGKLLGKGQTTEEVHSDDCTGDDDGLCKVKKEMDPFTEVVSETTVAALLDLTNKIQVAIHQASILPDHFTPNIPTPPPDFC